MRTPNTVELYNSQSTESLEGMRDRYISDEQITSQTTKVVEAIDYILLKRKENKRVKNCMEVCDGSCKELCDNRM